MIAHDEDTRSNTFFSQLINLKQKGSVTEHIENFQRLNIKVTDIPDEHLIDVFIGTLKEDRKSTRLISIMCHIHKRYELLLYIYNLINLFGIDGFVLANHSSLGQCSRKK